MTVYSYTVDDTLNDSADGSGLFREVLDSSISTATMEAIDIAGSGLTDAIDLTFSGDLSAGDQTTLTTTVNNHPGTAPLVSALDPPNTLLSLGQTTDATQTNFDLEAMYNDNEVLCLDNWTIFAKEAATVNLYIRGGNDAIYTRAGGTITQIDKTTKAPTRSGLAGSVTADLIISGTKIQVQVTGEVSKTIDWYASISSIIR